MNSGKRPVKEKVGTLGDKDPGGMEDREGPAAMKPGVGSTATRDAGFPKEDEDENWTW